MKSNFDFQVEAETDKLLEKTRELPEDIKMILDFYQNNKCTRPLVSLVKNAIAEKINVQSVNNINQQVSNDNLRDRLSALAKNGILTKGGVLSYSISNINEKKDTLNTLAKKHNHQLSGEVQIAFDFCNKSQYTKELVKEIIAIMEREEAVISETYDQGIQDYIASKITLTRYQKV